MELSCVPQMNPLSARVSPTYRVLTSSLAQVTDASSSLSRRVTWVRLKSTGT